MLRQRRLEFLLLLVLSFALFCNLLNVFVVIRERSDGFRGEIEATGSNGSRKTFALHELSFGSARPTLSSLLGVAIVRFDVLRHFVLSLLEFSTVFVEVVLQKIGFLGDESIKRGRGHSSRPSRASKTRRVGSRRIEGTRMVRRVTSCAQHFAQLCRVSSRRRCR